MPANVAAFPADPRGQAFAAHVLPEVEVLLRAAMTQTSQPADAEDLVQEPRCARTGPSTASTGDTRARGC